MTEDAGRDVITFRREDGIAENFHVNQNRELLEKLSAQTGGRYYTPSQISRLGDEITYSEAGITTRETRDLWNMPVLFLLILLLRGPNGFCAGSGVWYEALRFLFFVSAMAAACHHVLRHHCGSRRRTGLRTAFRQWANEIDKTIEGRRLRISSERSPVQAQPGRISEAKLDAIAKQAKPTMPSLSCSSARLVRLTWTIKSICPAPTFPPPNWRRFSIVFPRNASWSST